MRKIVLMLFGLPFLLNCSRDVVVSTAYPKSDGRAAFILDLNKSDGAFELRAVRPEGSESDDVAEIAVSQCANGQLDLSIETCTRGSVACSAVLSSRKYGTPIDNVCGDRAS